MLIFCKPCSTAQVNVSSLAQNTISSSEWLFWSFFPWTNKNSFSWWHEKLIHWAIAQLLYSSPCYSHCRSGLSSLNGAIRSLGSCLLSLCILIISMIPLLKLTSNVKKWEKQPFPSDQTVIFWFNFHYRHRNVFSIINFHPFWLS